MQIQYTPDIPASLARRRFVQSAVAGKLLAGFGLFSPVLSVAAPRVAVTELHGPNFELDIAPLSVNFTGNSASAMAINGSIPAPLLRMREGDDIVIKVTNHLPITSSIHWHGLILPSAMDGVPGLSFNGIAPGASFTYRFRAQQSGTYWYHSHSGFQEQTGLYGPIVIEPRQADPVQFDREYVVQFSDWSDEAPEQIYAKLKKLSHYYNTRERTLADLWQEIRDKGLADTVAARQMWNEMRMSDRDISDVTAMTYTYLTNGNAPASGWEGIFRPGERVRLRLINSSSMTFFDVRIPGLKMEVVAADGQNIRPVANIDEIRMGVAETYDVIVQPAAGTYTLFAQAIDRSGYACGFLTCTPGEKSAIPALDASPVLTHGDMGMMHMHAMPAQGKSQGQGASSMHMDHSMHGGSMSASSPVQVVLGPQVDMLSPAPQRKLGDPGVGLRQNGRRVLRYSDLRNLQPTADKRPPQREIELHLTGNMNRYMWSFNGVKFADAMPIALQYGERLRITLINDTMMNHPIHLHGMWSELETGDPEYLPRKHTVIVQPGSKISYLLTADAKGQWAYHCHLLYHMEGMMRRVVVS